MKKIKAFIRHIWGDHPLTDILIEILGGFLTAVAINNFAAPAGFLMTGFSGIALILYNLWGLPMGLVTLLMNVPVAILCYKLIGKTFFFKSIRCMIISSLLIDYAAPLLPNYPVSESSGSMLVAVACTAVLAGIGYAMIYMRNSSTGGTDFIVMAVKSKNQHIKLGRLIFITDATVVIVGGILLKNFDGIIYGLIIDFVCGFIADKMMFGLNSGRMTMIVTDKPHEVNDAINAAVERGTTIMKAEGGHTGQEHSVVMCACSPREIERVESAVKKADPAAFTVILESNEILGYGFNNVKVAEHEESKPEFQDPPDRYE